MKTSLLIAIGIILGIAIIVGLTTMWIPTMEANHQKECIYDGGKVTGFLQCTRVHMDYALESTTVYINLGVLDPQSKNPIFPKEMTVILGENNTVAWLNTDGPSHFINFEDWALGPIHQGERQSVTFNHTGVYKYFSADSPSILGTVIVKSDLDINDLENFASILAEINEEAAIYQKNDNPEKSERQLNLMKEKQAEIASKILGVVISEAYVAEGWNYPFKESSGVTVFNPEFEKPICDIPEKIPMHLQIIQQSDMFQMFAGKYSQHHMMIDISDERNGGGLVHYDLIATSDNEEHTASTNFHLDSCTGEFAYNKHILMCKNLISEERSFATYPANIRDSLDDNSFCVFAFKPWQENLFEYGHILSEQAEKLYPYSYYDESEEFQEEKHDSFKKSSELKLLAKISYDAGHMVDKESLEDEISKYEKRYNKMPDELQKLIDVRPAE